MDGGGMPGGRPATGRETVYLHRFADGWRVRLDEVVLLSTEDEDQAFRCACDARRCESAAPRRLLIVSGRPGASASAAPPAE